MSRPLEAIIYVADHQFYLCDTETDWSGQFLNNPLHDDSPGLWPGMVCIRCPRTSGPVPVFLEMHRAGPALPDERFCKIVEADLGIPSGRLQIYGEQNTEALPGLHFEVEPGQYVARILYSDLSTVTYDGSDGAEHYFIQLYPASRPGQNPASYEPEIQHPEVRILRPYEDLDNPVVHPVDERSVDELHWMAQHGTASERCSTTVALARQKQLKAVQHLALNDPSRAVRLVALGALAMMGARQYLKMVADRESGFLERTARMHLARLE